MGPRFRFLPLSLLILTVTVAANGIAATVFVSGRVLDRKTHHPVPGATVALYALASTDPLDTAVTLANGAYVLKAPGPGHFRLVVDGAVCQRMEREIDLPAGGIPSLELAVVQDAPLQLRLVGPDGKPVTTGQAEVWGTLSWGDRPATYGAALPPTVRTVSADGTLEVMPPHFIPLDSVNGAMIRVRSPEAGCGQIHLDRWPDDPTDVYLEKGASLVGGVFNAAGQPAAGIRVTVQRVEGDSHWGTAGLFNPDPQLQGLMRAWMRPSGAVTATTGDDGKFHIPALFFGRYMVRAVIPGVGERYRVVELTGAASDVTISPSDEAWPPVLQFPEPLRLPRGPRFGPAIPGLPFVLPFGGPFAPRYLPAPAPGQGRAHGQGAA